MMKNLYIHRFSGEEHLRGHFVFRALSRGIILKWGNKLAAKLAVILQQLFRCCNSQNYNVCSSFVVISGDVNAVSCCH